MRVIYFTIFFVVVLAAQQAAADHKCPASVDDCCPPEGVTYHDCRARPPSEKVKDEGSVDSIECCKWYKFNGVNGPERYHYPHCPFALEFVNVSIPVGTIVRVHSIKCKEGCKVAFIGKDALDHFFLPMNGPSFSITFTGPAPSFKWRVVAKKCSCANGCYPGWINYKGICYHINNCFDNWANHKNHCEAMNSQLICINDDDTKNFIAKMSGELTWIGMTTSNQGQDWTCLIGNTPFVQPTYWAPNYPLVNKGRDCALTSVGNNGLTNESCGVKNKAICCKNAGV